MSTTSSLPRLSFDPLAGIRTPLESIERTTGRGELADIPLTPITTRAAGSGGDSASQRHVNDDGADGGGGSRGRKPLLLVSVASAAAFDRSSERLDSPSVSSVVTSGSGSVSRSVSTSWSARSWCLADEATGKVLVAHNPDLCVQVRVRCGADARFRDRLAACFSTYPFVRRSQASRS
jgi:hypothetical protein